MRLGLVSTEELVYALEFCGITPAKNPADISKDSMMRLISIMKTPILQSIHELVFPTSNDLINLTGLSSKDKVPDVAANAQEAIRFVFAANFSAVALSVCVQDPKKHKNFKSNNAIDAFVYLITNGQPFGQFYAIQALISLLRSPDQECKSFFTKACFESTLLSAIMDCTDALNYDWQLDNTATLIEVLFDNISGGICLFEASTVPGRPSSIFPHQAVQLIHGHASKCLDFTDFDATQQLAPALPINHATATALLVYLIRRLHNTFWSDQSFSHTNNSMSTVDSSNDDSPTDGFLRISRAIIAVLRFPSIRECMDEARVLCTVASIFAAQDSATIAPSHECIHSLLEIAILCMTPLSSDIMSVRNQAFLESVDVVSLLGLDFFCILARLLINIELVTSDITKCLLVCFALMSKNSTWRMNCLNSLASSANSEDISILTIASRLLDDPVQGSDITTIHLILTMLSGFCTHRQFRQTLYSDTSLINKIVDAIRQVLSLAIDLTPVVTAHSSGENKNVLSSQNVMSVLTAAMNESSAEDDGKEESSSLMASLRTSATGSLGESLRDSLLRSSELKASDVHFTNSVHMKHSHIFGTKSSRRAVVDLGRSIHLQVNDGDNYKTNTAVTLNLAPIAAHMKIFMAASELISTICVDYGILIDFTRVNFYNPRLSSNNALGNYAKVLLNSFFPCFIEIAEFLRTLVIVSPAFILEPIMEIVLGALYEISQLDLALVPFLSGQTDIVLLRNKFRLCTKKRMPVLTPLEIRALRCLILFVRNSRIVSLSLFTCALLRKADCCNEVIDTDETVCNTFLAVKHAQAYMDRLKYIHFGNISNLTTSDRDWTILRKAATGPICDIAIESSTLLALLTTGSPDIVTAEAAAAVLNLWNCLFTTNPNEMEFVFNSIAYMLNEWPRNRCGSLRGQLGNRSLEKLVDDLWGKQSSKSFSGNTR